MESVQETESITTAITTHIKTGTLESGPTTVELPAFITTLAVPFTKVLIQIVTETESAPAIIQTECITENGRITTETEWASTFMTMAAAISENIGTIPKTAMASSIM